MTRSLRPALMAGGAAFCILFPGVSARASSADDHAVAQAALGDLRAARAVITTALDSYETDPAAYRSAAQKAINVLVGTHDPAFVPAAGRPDDEVGAIGRLDALLNRSDPPIWANATRGAEVNASAAVARLQTATRAHELGDFQIAATQALDSLLVAEGRSSDPEVFGGLLGALGNTELGVPLGVHTMDACTASAQIGWALHGGRLAFVAVAPGSPIAALDGPLGVVEIVGTDGLVVLRTAAWPMVQRDCAAPKPGKQAAASASPQAAAGEAHPASPQVAGAASGASPSATGSPVTQQQGGATPSPAAPANALAAAATPAGAAASPTPSAASTAASEPFPALYTMAQARAGKAVYAANCVTCHGTDLHGVAAPALAGTDFLKSAADNDWSLEAIRTIIFTMMPLNASGSLSPEQYADVTAYILASNCLPAGTTPFPQDDASDFDKVQLHPLDKAAPAQNELGVCPVS